MGVKKNWAVFEERDSLHVIPMKDTKRHSRIIRIDNCQFEDGSTTEMHYCPCACGPTHQYENNILIVTHRSFDGREGVEWVNEILNQG